jgi:cytochrome c oxidase subunit 4
MAQDYQASKKTAVKIISILAFITIVEVVFALLGKGYIIEGVHFPLIVLGGIMIIMSIIKAYLIVYEFMHMKYEVPALMKSVLLPTLLLVWAVIAFLAEGSDWGDRRDLIKEKNEASIKEAPSTGMLYRIK